MRSEQFQTRMEIEIVNMFTCDQEAVRKSKDFQFIPFVSMCSSRLRQRPVFMKCTFVYIYPSLISFLIEFTGGYNRATKFTIYIE
jgi:hypothetical protein